MLDYIAGKIGLKSWGRVAMLSSLVGILSGLFAAGLHHGLHFAINHVIAPVYDVTVIRVFDLTSLNYWLIVMPMAGALVGSVLVWLFARKAIGHGTGLVIHAFHHGKGIINPIEPLIKGLAAICTIASGGSAGPEGPIAHIGAGLGSWVGMLSKVSVRDRRRLLLAGAAAGMGAIFQAPLGAAIMASEMLYRDTDFEHDAILPCLIASVTSYATFLYAVPYHGPMFEHIVSSAGEIYGIAEAARPKLTNLFFQQPLELPAYIGLAVLAALTSIFFVKSFGWLHKRFFRALRLPQILTPVAGAFFLGLLLLIAPPVMDATYSFVGRLFYADQIPMAGASPWFWLVVMAMLLIGKIIGTGFTVGSGGSGGMLGPSIYIGGVLGAIWGSFLKLACEAFGYGAWIGEDLRRSLVIVGMGAFFGCANRVPVAAVIMLSEMTGAHGLLVPLMLSCALAYVIGRHYGINPEQVESLSDSPAHFGDYAVDVLADLKVHEVLHVRTNNVRFQPSATLFHILETMKNSPQECFPVVNDQGKLEGVVHLKDIRKVLHEDRSLEQFLIARDLAVADYPTIPANADLHTAVRVMAERDVQDLVVMCEDDPGKVLGVLSHHDISAAYTHRTADLALMDEAEARVERLKRRSLSGHGQDVTEMDVPAEIVGQSLRNADFRKKFGKQVVGIRNPNDGTLQIPADPDTPLEAHHVLLVMTQG